MILSTSRLTIRKLTVADAPFILQLVNDPAWLKFIGDKNIHGLSDAKEYILNGPIKSYEKLGFGLYLVQLKENHESIGICGLIKREFLADVDIGFAFMPSFRRKGYGYESALAIINHAHKTLGLKRILAITALNNTASIKLLQKLGMRFDKIIRFGEEKVESRLFMLENT